MSFDTIKALANKQAFTVVELILDKNDPALDATFALQADSYGTPKTTDDANAYTGVDFRTYRYSDQQLFGVDHFIGLKSAKTNPPRIDPGVSIGFRASGTITLKDFKSNDSYELPSPYDDRRVTGSHFTKLFARNHLKNRRIRVIRGYDPFNYDEANTQIENYIIDSFSHPSDDGIVTINVIDELILVESKKSKAPTVSKGELSSDMTDVTTALAYTTTVTDEYGAVSATGYLAVEKEVMSYVVDSSTAMTVGRAAFGTEAASHTSGDTVQKCIVFDDENIIDIITQLITDHTNIDTSYIPTSDWAALKTGDLADYNLTRVLFKPVDVQKLLNELIALAGLAMYVDVINQSIVINAVPDFASPVITFDETEHLEQGSIRVKNNNRKQVTRRAIFWNKINVADTNDDQSYSKQFQVIDGVVEGAADEGEASEPKPLKTDWLVNSLEDNRIATNFAQREINRFSRTPLDVNFTVDQRYIGTVTGGRMWLGSIFAINTSKIVDGGLNNVVTNCQCVSLKPSNKENQWDVAGLSYIAAVPPNADLYIDEDKTDYLLTDELTTDTAREYVVVINSGIVIGASLTSTLSFDQGTFFAGATLKLVILGSIIAAGGAGGTGSTASPTGPTCALGTPGNGSTGGDALNLTTDATIDNGFGLIGGGGGGGAGNLGVCYDDPDPGLDIAAGGKGGGGGQGQAGGAGGVGGVGTTGNGATGDAGTLGAAGDNGGGLGQDGGDIGAATGGAAGRAILTNGNTVTITAGNNSEQIKGATV
jgi:hypothetical protein